AALLTLRPLTGSGEDASDEDSRRVLKESVEKLQHVNAVLTRILATANSLVARADLDDLLQQIAVAASELLGYEVVLVNLVDQETDVVRMAANVGLDQEAKRLLEEPTVRMTWNDLQGILDDRYRCGLCYFIPAGDIDWHGRFDYCEAQGSASGRGDLPPSSTGTADAWDPQDALLCLIRTAEDDVAGMMSLDRPSSGLRPDIETLRTLEVFAGLAAVSIQSSRLYERLSRELRERTAAEEELQRTREHLEEKIHERTEELRKANETLREEEERYRSLHDNIPVGVFRSTADPSGRLLTANMALARMFGYGIPEQMDQVTVAELYEHPQDRSGFIDAFSASGEVMGYEAEFRRADGSTFWGSLTARAVTETGSGRILYFDGILEDVTEQKDAQEALRESEQRFRELFENSIIGVYRTTPDGRVVMANPAMIRMLGYDDFEDLASIDLEGELYFPDYPRSDFKRQVEKEGRVIGLEATWRRKNGTKLFVRESSVAVTDGSGGVLYYAGTVEDITERRLAEQALKASETRYRTLFESARDAIFIMREDMFVDCNPQTLKMFGLEGKDQIVGGPPWVFSPEKQPDGSDSKELALEKIRAALRGEDILFDWTHTRLDGTVFYTEVSLNRITIDDEIRIQAIVRDITDRKKSEKELERLARTDYLTGLHNRLYFMERLREEFLRARRYGSMLSMMILDLDRFKQINDTYGHLVGDEVLARAAGIVQSTLRKCDIVGRYGGEEFCAVMPETGLEGGLVLAERLRLRLEEETFTGTQQAGLTLGITCSIGVASLGPGMEEVNDLIRTADDALYNAKAGGRNRVCSPESSPEA
ncbi:diguanylate cyclase, partial [Candidatus Fermentibacterales bacterium]|nr:diguanylate cyclase [Candidatus Fermentibacterales bacterium]